MRLSIWGNACLAAAVWLLMCITAHAAPERLGDLVPDAVPDLKGTWAFMYGHEALDLEGPLTGEKAARDYFKLRYTFSPKVAATIGYSMHDLGGAYAIATPVMNNMDSATGLNVDLNLNLMNTPRTEADPAKQVAFAAGSSFGIGINATQFNLSAADLDQSETLINAYLTYSTDLTEEMRAHTFFSSGRLSGDTYTGSVNRVGAGLDYAVIPGRRPLELLASGVLDIYNFRQPTFNTSRVSRFDIGMRYRLSKDWYATLGWATVNDSETNNSGSGLFGSVNYIQMPPEPKVCPPAPEAAPPAAPPAASAPAAESSSQLAAVPQPELMALAPAQPQRSASSAAPGADSGKTASNAVLPPAEPGTMSLEPQDASHTLSAVGDAGILIPELKEQAPAGTPADAVLLRAGVDDPAAERHQTSSADIMLRPALPVHAGPDLGALIASAIGQATAPASTPATTTADAQAQPEPVAPAEKAVSSSETPATDVDVASDAGAEAGDSAAGDDAAAEKQPAVEPEPEQPAQQGVDAARQLALRDSRVR